MKKQDTQLTAEIIWAMFAETDRRFKETDKMLSEKFKETDLKFKETDKMLSEKFKETDLQFKETDRKIEKTGQQIREMVGHFDRQFGKLVEALIRYSTIKLFQDRGIDITHSAPNPCMSYGKQTMEFDLFLLNDTEMVVIEAKVSLNKQKVYKFIQKINNFKLFFKSYKSYAVHAALAYVTADEAAIELAEEHGFYLLKLKDEEYMEIANSMEFKPLNY